MVHCEGKYNDGKGNQTPSYSILMHLEHEYCNACCDYCCCHPIEPGSNIDVYDKYKADYPKMINKIKECPLYKPFNGKDIHFDLWGGEPLYNLKALKELINVLRKEWPECSLTISTNGLLLGSMSVVDYLIDNKISVQLSHDGWGQWIRTKEVDPLDNEVIIKGIKRINDAGLFAAINCTLTKYNYSWLKNISYFTDKMVRHNLDKIGYIKLNHIYNSDYNIDRINALGHWQDGFKEELKGTKIGDVGIRGKIADEYFSEFFSLAMFYRDPSTPKDPYISKFKNYIMEQSKRWGEVDETKQSSGACRAYQSWKYDIKDNYKRDWTFVINTLGEYCECNLCEKVDNPGSPMAEYCKDCKYKNQSECHSCGSMFRPKECDFLYKWCQTLEKIHKVDVLLKEVKNGSNKKPN